MILLCRFARRIWRDKAFWAKVVDPCAKATPAKYSTIEKKRNKKKTMELFFFVCFWMGHSADILLFGREKKGGNKNTICDFIIF